MTRWISSFTSIVILCASSAILADVPGTVVVFNGRGTSKSERVLVASVAGIVAKRSPELYTGPSRWIDALRKQRPEVKVERESDVASLLERYRKDLRGYVLYDQRSINVATSVAGIERAAMIDESTLALAKAAGLKERLDVRGKDIAWAAQKYRKKLDRSYLFHQFRDDRHHLRDFAILKNGLVLFEEKERDRYFAAQTDHTRIFGWASSEHDFFSRSSRHHLHAVAADWLRGAAATSGWTVPLSRQRTHVSEKVATDANVHYVTFVMSDGDNVQWLTNSFCERKWFGSPHRGKFDMTWDISPSLAEINPVAFNHLLTTASTGEHRDFFVNAGGPGLIFPSLYPDIEGFVKANSAAMRHADLNVISILETRWRPEKIDAILDDEQVLGAMLKIGNAYRGHHGRIHWRRGKPCVSVRYTLWERFDTPESIARDVNKAPRKPLEDQRSYSVVNVHPWSGDAMARVHQKVKGFEKHVCVVTLEELIVHLRRHFGRPVKASELE